jgi:hypothetical protein
MRFALAEIEPELRQITPGFRELTIRVRPRRAAAPSA